MTQQEPGQLLAGLAQAAHCRQTGTREIADRFVRLIGYPNRRQFASPVQLGEVDRIPSVGLGPIVRLDRDQRGGYDDALMPGIAQLTLNAVTARLGFITKFQAATTLGKLVHQLRQGG